MGNKKRKKIEVVLVALLFSLLFHFMIFLLVALNVPQREFWISLTSYKTVTNKEINKIRKNNMDFKISPYVERKSFGDKLLTEPVKDPKLRTATMILKKNSI